jgi:hypothetical protein
LFFSNGGRSGFAFKAGAFCCLAGQSRFWHRFGVIPQYNTKSLLYGVPGLVIQIASIVPLQMAVSGHASAPWILALCAIGKWVGTGLLVAGFCYYAKAKGRNGAWGLVAFLSCIGLIILVCLEDKTKNKDGTPSTPSPQP